MTSASATQGHLERMICTVCMKQPYKRSCFPCQWNAWKIDVNGYDRCKDCWRKGLTAEDRNRLAWHKLALGMDLDDWGKDQDVFIVAWVKFAAGDRKCLSYRGGLWSRCRGDPVCWTDSAGLSTFDPGNWIYRDAVTKCVGDALFTAYGMCNEETVGDVIESLFGYVRLVAESEEEREAILRTKEIHGGKISIWHAYRFWQIMVYHVHWIHKLEAMQW